MSVNKFLFCSSSMISMKGRLAKTAVPAVGCCDSTHIFSLEELTPNGITLPKTDFLLSSCCSTVLSTQAYCVIARDESATIVQCNNQNGCVKATPFQRVAINGIYTAVCETVENGQMEHDRSPGSENDGDITAFRSNNLEALLLNMSFGSVRQ